MRAHIKCSANIWQLELKTIKFSCPFFLTVILILLTHSQSPSLHNWHALEQCFSNFCDYETSSDLVKHVDARKK